MADIPDWLKIPIFPEAPAGRIPFESVVMRLPDKSLLYNYCEGKKTVTEAVEERE